MIPEYTRTGEADVKEQGFTSHFSVDGENHSFSVRYYGDEWRSFPDHMKRQLAELVSSVWVAAIPSEDKIFTHRLSEPDIEYLKFIAYQTQTLYRYNMQYPAIEETPTLHVTRGDNDWSGLELETDGCGAYFSGGINSFYTLHALETSGYEPQVININNGSEWDTGERAREAGIPTDTAWNNFGVLKREITKDHTVFWDDEAPVHQITWLMSLPMLEQGLNLFGNPVTTTRFISVGEDVALNNSWEQSIISNEIVTQWAQSHGINLRVGSILRELSNYRILRGLIDDAQSYWDLSVSCIYVDKEDDYSPCSKCTRCHRNYLCLEAIGADTSEYDEERIKEFKMEPSELMWKTMLPTDLSHINHKAKMSFGVPDQDRPEIEGLIFKNPRSNPSRFLTRDEFKSIYQNIMGDDKAWFIYGAPIHDWAYSDDLDEIYDLISDWEVPSLDTTVKVKDNNSLLDI